MDRMAMEKAIRKYFQGRNRLRLTLLDELAAAGVISDDVLRHQLELDGEYIAALDRIGMIRRIKEHLWSTSGAGRKAVQALLLSLAEAGTTDAQLPPSPGADSVAGTER